MHWILIVIIYALGAGSPVIKSYPMDTEKDCIAAANLMVGTRGSNYSIRVYTYCIKVADRED